MALRLVYLVGGEPLNAHVEDECRGPYCTIHNNSDHHMVKWKQTWDGRVGRIMRICPHNVAHPDPDEINPNTEHYCDTCCDPASQFQVDAIELTKDYVKPDYLTPTSHGPISTGVHMHVTPEPIPGTLESLEKLLTSFTTTRHKGTDL